MRTGGQMPIADEKVKVHITAATPNGLKTD